MPLTVTGFRRGSTLARPLTDTDLRSLLTLGRAPPSMTARFRLPAPRTLAGGSPPDCATRATRQRLILIFRPVPGVEWDPLESTCRHASLSIL